MTGAPESGPVVELLAMLAHGELLAFERMAADARLAPDLSRRAVLCEMAAGEIVNYRRLAARLSELGADPEQVMAPYVAPLRAYHDRTRPRDWLEVLTKAYVNDSVADDFVREVSEALTNPDRRLVREVLHDSRYGEFAADEIRTAITADPAVANRLSMWARRLVGEALTQAQQVAAARPTLATLLAGVGAEDHPSPTAHSAQPGIEPAGPVPALLRRLTRAHADRMAAVGLNN